MATIIVLIFLFSLIFALSHGRLEGLYLHPEILKNVAETYLDNDYIDYNPGHWKSIIEMADSSPLYSI